MLVSTQIMKIVNAEKGWQIHQLMNAMKILMKKQEIIDNNKNKCNSCVLYVVLFSMFFTINVVIAAYFVYYKYMNRNKENVYQTKNY